MDSARSELEARAGAHHRLVVDLEKKLAMWEDFYNYDRPHGAHQSD